jgi:hypothetical protein
MTATRRGVCFGAAGWLFARTAGGSDPARDLVARIGKARAGLKTLRGPFEQTRTIGLLATDVRSRGELALVCPERLRWELFPPDSVTFWVGPEGLAYRSEHGHGRVAAENANIGGALDDLRAILGGDLARLGDRWDMHVTKDDGTGAEVEATPKANVPARLRLIRFGLLPDLVRPNRVLLAEGPRDRTTIEFGALTVNGTVDPAWMLPPS